MFQFYFKEKFDVLRMFRLSVSSRYRRVRKMQLHLVLSVLFTNVFIPYLKRIMHQSFVSTAPTYGDSRGLTGIRCWTCTCTFRKCGGITLGHLPCWDFLLCRVGQRAGLLHVSSACPHRAGLIPGLWKVKTIIPAHPRRWGSSGYK